MADDFGRFEADPAVLASTTFPLRNGKLKLATVSGWFQELIASEHVRAYVIKGTRYGQFVHWEAHQGKPRAKISKFPAPTDNEENQHDSNCEQMRANAPVFVSESDIRIRDSYSEIRCSDVAHAAPSTNARTVKLQELESLTLTPELQEWASREFSLRIPPDVLDEFKAYWREQKKLRTDWTATLKSRVRQLVADGRLKPGARPIQAGCTWKETKGHMQVVCGRDVIERGLCHEHWRIREALDRKRDVVPAGLANVKSL